MAGVPTSAPATSSGGGGGGMGLVGPIAGLIGTGLSIHQANKANKEARGFALLQGDIEWQRSQQAWLQQQTQDQRNWRQQNQYNEHLWNMQNQYNSPAQQMARYKEAGLNPNLIYGQSNTGGSVSTANLESGNGPSGGRPGNYTPRVPQFDLQEGIMSYFQAKEASARISNLEEQNRLIQQDALLRATQTANIAAETEGRGIENKRNSSLLQVSIDAAGLNLEKLRNELTYGQHADERAGQMNQQQLAESRERILKIMGEQENIKLDNQIKQIQIEMMRDNIMPHDGAVIRFMQRQIKRFDKIPRWNGKVLPGDGDTKVYEFFNPKVRTR